MKGERSRRSGVGSARRRKRRDGVSVPLVAGLLTLILLLLGALVGLGLYSAGQRVEIDEVTLCPNAKHIPELLVILLDSSDRLGEAQKLRVLHELEREQMGLPKFGRLDVYSMGGVGELVEPVLTICNPGDGTDLSELVANPVLARKRWETAFKARVDETLREGIEAREAPTSPIFEAIQAAAVRTFDLPVLDAIRSRRMLIVSDLLQNVPGKMSHYQDSLDFESFSSSAYFEEVRAPLKGVQVGILYLARARAAGAQGRKHIDFWTDYLGALGASTERVTRISGESAERSELP